MGVRKTVIQKITITASVKQDWVQKIGGEWNFIHSPPIFAFLSLFTAGAEKGTHDLAYGLSHATSLFFALFLQRGSFLTSPADAVLLKLRLFQYSNQHHKFLWGQAVIVNAPCCQTRLCGPFLGTPFPFNDSLNFLLKFLYNSK